MADARYRFSLKSEEVRGASQPNILYIMLGSDADADVFAANLELAHSAHVVTIDRVVTRDYALPYPAGTGRVLRGAMWDGAFHEAQMMIYNVSAATNEKTLASDLISGGIKMPVGAFPAATAINFYDITPPESW